MLHNKLAVIPVNKVIIGTILIPDDGFDCLIGGVRREVFDVNGQLAVDCSEGAHFLDGQTQTHSRELVYIGFYLEDTAK